MKEIRGNYFSSLQNTVKAEKPKIITIQSVEKLFMAIRHEAGKNDDLIRRSSTATQNRQIG